MFFKNNTCVLPPLIRLNTSNPPHEGLTMFAWHPISNLHNISTPWEHSKLNRHALFRPNSLLCHSQVIRTQDNRPNNDLQVHQLPLVGHQTPTRPYITSSSVKIQIGKTYHPRSQRLLFPHALGGCLWWRDDAAPSLAA